MVYYNIFFNISLGVFPGTLEIVKVTDVFKTGEKDELSNFRDIALQARNPGLFRVWQFSWNLSSLINISFITDERKTPKGKNWNNNVLPSSGSSTRSFP